MKLPTRRRLEVCLLVSFTLILALVPARAQQAPPPSLTLPPVAIGPAPLDIGTALFYAVPGDSSAESFRAHADSIAVIAPQSFALDRYGRLKGSLPTDIAAIAHAHGVAVMPLVVNADFSKWGAIRMLRSLGARDRAVGALVDTARDLDLAGWQIDFENLPSSQRAAFSRFVAEAAGALHRHGKLLSVAVGARTSDDPGSNNYRGFSGVYDYVSLGRSADFLSVMAYPESDAAHPGPLASYPWVEKVVQHVLQEVPPDKVSLGLPTYQTDWVERRIRVSFRRRVAGRIRRIVHWIYRLIHHSGPAVDAGDEDLQWDPTLQSSYRIEGEGHSRKVLWVEDERSFEAKLRLVSQYHLRGFSVWRIGLEDPRIWNKLPEAVRTEAAAAPAAPGGSR